MTNPIHYNAAYGEYYVWLSRLGVKYIKYFPTAESAFEFVQGNPRVCMEVSKNESVSKSWATAARTAVETVEPAAHAVTTTWPADDENNYKKQLIFWIGLLGGSVLVAFYTSWLEGELQGSVLWHVAPLILGKATAMVLIPAILVGFIVLIRKFFKRRTSDLAVFIASIIIWIILVWSNINVASYEASMRGLSSLLVQDGLHV